MGQLGFAGDSALFAFAPQSRQDDVSSQASQGKATGQFLRAIRHRLTLWRRDGEIVAQKPYDYEIHSHETETVFHAADAKLLREMWTLLARGDSQLQSESPP